MLGCSDKIIKEMMVDQNLKSGRQPESKNATQFRYKPITGSFFNDCRNMQQIVQILISIVNKILQQQLLAVKDMEIEQSKYSLFLNWFKANGGKYEEKMIQYPVKYQPGDYPGVGTISQIPRNKVIVAIPFNLIITVNRVKQELPKLCQEVEKMEDDEEEDLEFLILTLYIIHQRQKGKQSFFHPYFNLVDASENMCDWNNLQILEAQDPYLFNLVMEEKQQVEYLFGVCSKYTQKYTNLFLTQVTMKQFVWSLNFVQTRCYGWGFPQTLLAPFADLFNHHSLDSINHYMLNGSFQSKVGVSHPAYIVKSDCLNIQLLGIKSREVKRYQPNDRIKILKKYFSEIPENDLVEYENQYWNKYIGQSLFKNPLQIQIFQSDDSEDNDSEEEDEEQETNSFEAQIASLRNKQNPPQRFMDLQLKQFVRPSLPINRQFQQECDFSWYKYDDKDTYFIISTARKVLAGEQLFNSYGQRSNRFLLLWYGFALGLNKFNSIRFRLKLQSEVVEVYEKYINQQQKQKGIKVSGKPNRIQIDEYFTQQFKLKESRLCQKLIMYLRFKLLKKSKNFDRKVTFPTNLQQQIQMLDLYSDVIRQLQKYYRSQTLSDDKKILQSSGLKERHVFAIIHRISNKKIIQIQWSLVQIAKKVIFDLIDGKSLREGLNTPRTQQKDDLFDNNQGRVFYARRLLGYLRPLSYLKEQNNKE